MTTAAETIAGCLRAYDKRQRPPRLTSKNTDGIAQVDFGRLERLRTVEGEIEELLRDAVASALKGRVCEEGWKLFQQGGLDAMLDVYYEVGRLLKDEDTEDENPRHLRGWWSGIGSGVDVWTP